MEKISAMNNKKNKTSWKTPNQPNLNNFQLADNWDQTIMDNNGNLEPWDHYIIDEDIVKLLGMLFKPTPDKMFARNQRKRFAKFYFTSPFSETAKELGYENENDDSE